MKVGHGETLQFALGPIEVELTVAVEKKGDAGVKCGSGSSKPAGRSA
jgi:hypothetical protein